MEAETDVQLMIECLRESSVEVVTQALQTLASMCTKPETAEIVAKGDGLSEMLSLLKKAKRSSVKQMTMFTLGCAISNNVASQMSLCRPELFEILHSFMQSPRETLKLKCAASFLATMMISHNVIGQRMSLEHSLLKSMMAVFRSLCSGNLSDLSDVNSVRYNLMSSVSSALSAAVNNPQNVENQRVCCSLYPCIASLIPNVHTTPVLSSLINFLAACSTNHSMNQERIRAVGGLKALAIALQEQVASDSISTAQCDHTSAVIIVDALIHCVNASSNNQSLLVNLDVIFCLIRLLKVLHKDTDKLKVVTCIHLLTNDNELGQKQVINHNGVAPLVGIMAAAQESDLKRAAVSVLQICIGRNQIEQCPRSPEDNSLVKKIDNLQAKLKSCDVDQDRSSKSGSSQNVITEEGRDDTLSEGDWMDDPNTIDIAHKEKDGLPVTATVQLKQSQDLNRSTLHKHNIRYGSIEPSISCDSNPLQQSTSHDRPSASHDRPSTSHDRPSTSHDRPSTSHDRPSTSHDRPSQPLTGSKLPSFVVQPNVLNDLSCISSNLQEIRRNLASLEERQKLGEHSISSRLTTLQENMTKLKRQEGNPAAEQGKRDHSTLNSNHHVHGASLPPVSANGIARDNRDSSRDVCLMCAGPKRKYGSLCNSKNLLKLVYNSSASCKSHFTLAKVLFSKKREMRKLTPIDKISANPKSFAKSQSLRNGSLRLDNQETRDQSLANDTQGFGDKGQRSDQLLVKKDLVVVKKVPFAKPSEKLSNQHLCQPVVECSPLPKGGIIPSVSKLPSNTLRNRLRQNIQDSPSRGQRGGNRESPSCSVSLRNIATGSLCEEMSCLEGKDDPYDLDSTPEDQPRTKICCNRKFAKKALRRRKRHPFTYEEECFLLEGVKDLGHKWREILDQYKFHGSRTPVDLKDKYRNLCKRH